MSEEIKISDDITVEQMCRELLNKAVESNLIYHDSQYIDSLTAGDLVGMANLLSEYLRFVKRKALEKQAIDNHWDNGTIR